MPEMPEDPLFALPVAPVAAAPPVHPPAVLDYAAPLARPPVYPVVGMPRAAAAFDLMIVAGVFAVFYVGLGCSGLASLLMEWAPDVGAFGTNALLGLFSLTLVAVVLMLRRQSPATIGINRPRRLRLAWSIPAAVPACYAASLLSGMIYMAFAGFDAEAVMEQRTELAGIVADFPVALILPFSIFVGIHEEILFRGFFLSRLRTLTRSNLVAIVISSVAFGLMHFYQGTMGVLQTAAIGTALAIIATYARTLWPAIIAHAAFDGINILLIPYIMRWAQEMMDELNAAPAAIVAACQAVGM
ncbi:MAG: CPBP family intramembrane glutamic endopeptidase [Planctomycetota bacterium]